MVYFTCNHCGDSVKKNQVEKHFQTQCRNNVSVSCMDCNKDFNKSTYEKHTKCISEQEKYSAVGFQPKPSANKGERKQEQWVNHIQVVLGTKDLTSEQSYLANLILKHSNIPRKPQQFKNFVKGILPGVNLQAADQLWDIIQNTEINGKKKDKIPSVDENINNLKENEDQGIPALDVNALSKKERKQLKKKAKYEAELQEVKNEPSVENTECEAQDEVKEEKKKKKKKKPKKSGSDENKMGDGNLEEVQHSEGQSKKRGKKRKVEEIEGDVSQSKKKISKENGNIEVVLEDGSCNGKISKFNWHDTIVKLLESKSDKELSLKRLRKKVLAEYEALCGQPLPKHIVKFNKTVLKTPGVVVEKEVAKLIAAS